MSDARTEFLSFLEEANGTLAFALTGLALLRREVESMRPITIARGNIGPLIGWSQDDPNLPDNILSRPGWDRMQFLQNLAPSGKSAIYLGWAWITLVYDRWEDDYRHRFAREWSCALNDVWCDALGDLRCLRHDVSHRKGIATKQWSGKCKLLTGWLTLGTGIVVDAKRATEFYDIISADERAFYVTPRKSS